MSNKIENPLSNYSYINKDFNAVWAELLDTVGKLSAKWDPNSSNESDPGVVLIKLIALLADKANYNIDSNILELFPSTVSQSANAREIFNQLGYSMKWYRSGKGTLKLKFKRRDDMTKDEIENLPDYITIPKFTMFCDAQNETVYTSSYSDTLVSTSGSLTDVPVEVSQGIILDYEILGEKRVTAEQLDSHYRLYFNEINVAENGIYITNAEAENFVEWKRVDNLNVQPLLSKVYKFGVTRDNVCYIEFPSDIATIIPDGIFIKYIVTDGLSGNVAKNIIEKFYNNPTINITYKDGNEDSLALSSENITIIQPYPIVNGDDPETIDKAYENYSRTVGVFQTLVSLRDYTNAIYLFGQENEWVSNDIVTDRTNDVQSSYKIITKNGNIEYTKIQTVLKNDATYASYANGSGSALLHNPYDKDLTESTKINPYGGISELAVIESEDEFTGDDVNYIGVGQNANGSTSPADNGSVDIGQIELSLKDISLDDYEVTPFSLKMYLLQYCANPQASLDNYNKTFSMITFNEGKNPKQPLVDDIVNEILTEIDDYKSIQHEFTPLLNNRPCIFLNKYPVKAIIVPQYKLTVLQSNEIKTNVYQALFKALNSQEVNFGEEVSYDEVYDIIANADERIKSVILQPLDFKTFVVYYNPDKPSEDGLGGWEEKEFNINTKFTDDGVNWGIDCFAKSVLAGTTDIYKKDTNFNFALNQQKISKSSTTDSDMAKDVQKITTASNITLKAGKNYTIKANENIYLQRPNYEDATTYSSNIKFEYFFDEGGAPELNAIKDGTDFCIKGANSYLILYWKENDADSFYKYRVYSEGAVIKPSGFNMDKNVHHTIATKAQRDAGASVPLIGTKWRTETLGKVGVSDGTTYNILKDYWGMRIKSEEDIGYTSEGGVLSSTKSITSRKLKTISVTQSDDNYFYWILNQSTVDEFNRNVYRLFSSTTDTHQSYQLQTNEFLLICNSDLTGMSIFGSGTKIERTATEGTTLNTNWDAVVVDDITDLNDIGIDVLSEVWTQIKSRYKVDVTEMMFIALGEGAVIKTDYSSYNLSNEAIPLASSELNGDIYYKSSSSDSTFTQISQSDLDASALEALQGWSIFSKLNIDMSNDTPQVLYQGQKLECTTIDGKIYTYVPTGSNKIYLQSTESIATEGGKDIDITITDVLTGEQKYTTIYGYTEQQISVQSENSSIIYSEFAAKLLYKNGIDSITQEFDLPVGKYIVPVLIGSSDMYNVHITLTDTVGHSTISLLNKVGPNSDLSDTEVAIFKPMKGDIYYLALDYKKNIKPTIKSKLTISFTRYEDIDEPEVSPDTTTKVIEIQKIFKYTEREYENDYIEYEGDNFFEDVIGRMRDLDYNGIYNYTHEIPEEDYIEDPLDPNSFFKSNHIYNKFTICQIRISEDNKPNNDIVVTKNIK